MGIQNVVKMFLKLKVIKELIYNILEHVKIYGPIPTSQKLKLLYNNLHFNGLNFFF